MTSQKGWHCRRRDPFYTSTTTDYPPELIKEIMITLNETESSFAELFLCDKKTIQGWMLPEGNAHHRKPRGGNIRILNDLAEYARSKRTSTNSGLKLFFKEREILINELAKRYNLA